MSKYNIKDFNERVENEGSAEPEMAVGYSKETGKNQLIVNAVPRVVLKKKLTIERSLARMKAKQLVRSNNKLLDIMEHREDDNTKIEINGKDIRDIIEFVTCYGAELTCQEMQDYVDNAMTVQAEMELGDYDSPDEAIAEILKMFDLDEDMVNIYEKDLNNKNDKE